jgi:hypothetical protein
MNIDLFIELMVGAARNSQLEDIHAGKTPISKTGDFSDVYIVTPDREIPWTEASRISNEEMGPLKDSIRENIRYQLKTLMESGLEIKVKKNSALEKVLKENEIKFKLP